MESRANHFFVGLFVLATVAAGMIFLLWTEGAGTAQDGKRYSIFFPGPVDGVVRGTPVHFNGVRVGRVTGLTIDAVDTTRVRVDISVASRTPVRDDSRARISRQGLTGGATISLSAGTMASALLDASSARRSVLIPVAGSGTGGGLLDRAPQVLANADTAIAELNGILAQNRAPIGRVIANVEELSQALASNKGEIVGAIADVRKAARGFEKVAPLLEDTRRLVARLDGAVAQNEARFTATLTNIEAFSKTLADERRGLSDLLATAQRVAAGLEGSGKVVADAGRMIRRVEKLVADNEDTVQASLADTRKFTEALGKNAGTVDTVFGDLRVLSTRLSRSAVKLETTLGAVADFLGEKNGESVLADVREAVASFKTLSARLDASIGVNAEELTRSTKHSLAEVELFLRDGRRMVRTLDRVLAGIERSPQRLLFGGSAVPEYAPQ